MDRDEFIISQRPLSLRGQEVQDQIPGLGAGPPPMSVTPKKASIASSAGNSVMTSP